MDLNLLNSTISESISEFYDNIVDFLVRLPYILPRLSTIKNTSKYIDNKSLNRKYQKEKTE